jgi:hypothetical protein
MCVRPPDILSQGADNARREIRCLTLPTLTSARRPVDSRKGLGSTAAEPFLMCALSD